MQHFLQEGEADQHDPLLYNEELRQRSAALDNPLEWDDLPYHLISDVFEILGSPYRVVARR